jgi:2-amino-4-hydroxy-6-hydroxymethyldihydropteridine diphosphokinase
MTRVTAFIGLGSNLGDPDAQLNRAIQELAMVPQSRLTGCSSVYRSAPMGPQDQPEYRNAVARLDTALEPEALLDEMERIEEAHGRRRTRHWGPRTLDLDILLYGVELIATERLTIPHPGIAERNFVLYPLAELDSKLEIPGLGALRSLLGDCPDAGLTRLHALVQSAG